MQSITTTGKKDNKIINNDNDNTACRENHGLLKNNNGCMQGDHDRFKKSNTEPPVLLVVEKSQEVGQDGVVGCVREEGRRRNYSLYRLVLPPLSPSSLMIREIIPYDIRT